MHAGVINDKRVISLLVRWRSGEAILQLSRLENSNKERFHVCVEWEVKVFCAERASCVKS